jgi:hypothetical protein
MNSDTFDNKANATNMAKILFALPMLIGFRIFFSSRLVCSIDVVP